MVCGASYANSTQFVDHSIQDFFSHFTSEEFVQLVGKIQNHISKVTSVSPYSFASIAILVDDYSKYSFFCIYLLFYNSQPFR